MQKNLSNVLFYFGKIENFSFLKKSNIFKNLQILTNQIWFELFFDSSLGKKFSKSRIIPLSFVFHKLEFFLDFIQEYTDQIPIILEKAFLFFFKKNQDFFLIAIDEYINGRKKGSVLNSFNLKWDKKLWKNLEMSFNLFLSGLSSRMDMISLLFILFESTRYDIIQKCFREQKNTKRFVSFFENTKLYFLTKNHRKLLKNLFIFSFDSFFSLSKLKKFKTCEIFCVKERFGKCLHGKKICIRDTIEFATRLKHRSSLDTLRILLDILSDSGFANYKVYWINFSQRSLNNLLVKILTGSLGNELFHFEKVIDRKKFPKRLSSKNQIWYYNIKKSRPCILVKYAAVFGTGVINFGTKRYSHLYDVLIELEKIPLYLKFLVGCSFSLINNENSKYYENLSILLENDLISDCLKGGILLGMGLNLKDTLSAEKFITDTCNFIISNQAEPAVKYGACIALALCGTKVIYNPRKNNLYKTIRSIVKAGSVASEGAALSLGILFSGTASSFLLEEITTLIQETENEKIGKTLILTIALVFLGCKDDSEIVFDRLIVEKNPKIRAGAVFIFSLGFVGTGNVSATRKLLKLITLDPDDNVKKAISIGLGFIFFSKFNLIEKIFLQLAYHYNPFVRYGACFGIVLASYNCPGLAKVQFFLENLANDKIDFVRQGALIALGVMCLNSKKETRKKRSLLLFKRTLDKNSETNLVKFGAYIGLSLLNLGQEINLCKFYKENYFSNLITGLFLFINYWDWFLNLFFIFLLIN